jgi:hypothetical protein
MSPVWTPDSTAQTMVARCLLGTLTMAEMISDSRAELVPYPEVAIPSVQDKVIGVDAQDPAHLQPPLQYRGLRLSRRSEPSQTGKRAGYTRASSTGRLSDSFPRPFWTTSDRSCLNSRLKATNDLSLASLPHCLYFDVAGLMGARVSIGRVQSCGEPIRRDRI